MLINFRCECGKHIVMSRKFAGRRARCEQCGRIVVVPPWSTIPADMPEPTGGTPVPPAVSEDEVPIPLAPASPARRSAAASPTPATEAAPADEADEDSGVPALNVSGARISGLHHVGGDEPLLQRIPLAFNVGLTLCILAALLCLAATLLPWTNIPQPPGLSRTQGVLALFASQETLDARLDRPPPRGRQFWPLPAGLLAVSLLGALLPWRRFRGGALLVVAVASALAWCLIVHWLDVELLAWTPLARYLETPGVHTDTWRPTPASPGLAAWFTVGAIILVFAAALLNLRQSRREVVIAAVASAAVVVLGVCHLCDWYRPADARVDAAIQVTPPTHFTDLQGNSSSEAAAVITVWNRTARPLVLAPRRQPANPPAGRPQTSPWLTPWGEPDVVLALSRTDEPAAADRSETAPAAFTFARAGALGCVLRPAQATQISVRFAPVWDRWRAARHSRAGDWSLEFLNATQQVLYAANLDIPGAPHPDDDVIAGLLAALESAPAQAQTSLDAFLARARQLTDPATSPPAAEAQAALEQLRLAATHLHTCQDYIDRLRQLGIPPSEAAQEQVAQLERRLGGPTVSTAVALLADLQQRRAHAAAEKLGSLADAPPIAGSVSAAALELLPPLVLEHAAQLERATHHEGILELLMPLADSLQPRPDLRPQAAALLTQAARHALADSGTALVHPNGGLRSLAPGTAATAPPTDASPAPPPATAPAAADPPPAPPRRSLAHKDPGYLATVLARAVEWDPDVSGQDEFAYAQLLAGKRAGTLTEEPVTEFLARHPASSHAAEAECWLGLQALLTERFTPAAERFTHALEASPDGTHALLARLGLALATCNVSADDLLTRATAERHISEYLAAREDWSEVVWQLIVQDSGHAGGLLAEPIDTAWVEQVTLITSAEDLADWLATERTKLPWLRLSEKLDPQQERELRRFILGGGVILVSTPLFTTFGHVPCQQPDAALLRAEAHPVTDWNGQRLGYPFLHGSDSVKYDASESGVLIRAKPAREAGEKIQALLAVNEDWLAAVVRLHREGGAAIFLPPRIADTPGGRRFISGLVEYAAAQSSGGQRFEEGKVPSRSPRPARP